MKILNALLAFALWSFGVPAARAEIRVAFLEFYTPDGRLIQLEPEGRFAHVAISYEGGWLHSHPQRGVETISSVDLAKLGKITSVLVVHRAEISPSLANQFLGRPYDAEFSWSDERIYCSELVGKILGLPPEPMQFHPALWPERYQRLNGLPGISPDKIFKKLMGGI